MKRKILPALFLLGAFCLAVSVVAPPGGKDEAPEDPGGVSVPTEHLNLPDFRERDEAKVQEIMRQRRLLEIAALDLAGEIQALVFDHKIPGFDEETYSEQWNLAVPPDWFPGGEGAHFLSELQAFAVERPEMFAQAIALVEAPEDSDRGRLIAALKDLGAESARCNAFVKQLDPLNIPDVEDRRREAISRITTAGLPASPWLDGRNVTAAWDMEGPERGDALLFDDGVVRSASQGLWLVKFPEEVLRFLALTAGEAPSAELLWQTALFARWGVEHRDFEAALACYRRARSIGRRSWPDEDDEALGKRAAAQGLKHLVLAGKPPQRRPAWADRWRWSRVARVDESFRLREGARRWGSLSLGKLMALPPAEQAEAAVWGTYRWGSLELAMDSMPKFLAGIREGPGTPDNPAAWLRSLGWHAVPVLVDHLDDRTGTVIVYHEVHVLTADLCWLALRAFTGLPDPPGLPPDAPWISASVDLPLFQASMAEWWNRVRDLPEAERWADLFERGSEPATAWLMEHEPGRFFETAWKRTDTGSRRGQLQRFELERALSLAPREKLEALLQKTEGDAREAVKRAMAQR